MGFDLDATQREFAGWAGRWPHRGYRRSPTAGSPAGSTATYSSDGRAGAPGQALSRRHRRAAGPARPRRWTFAFCASRSPAFRPRLRPRWHSKAWVPTRCCSRALRTRSHGGCGGSPRLTLSLPSRSPSPRPDRMPLRCSSGPSQPAAGGDCGGEDRISNAPEADFYTVSPGPLPTRGQGESAPSWCQGTGGPVR